MVAPLPLRTEFVVTLYFLPVAPLRDGAFGPQLQTARLYKLKQATLKAALLIVQWKAAGLPSLLIDELLESRNSARLPMPWNASSPPQYSCPLPQAITQCGPAAVWRKIQFLRATVLRRLVRPK